MKLRIPKDWLHGIGEDSEQPLSGPAPNADAMIRQRQFEAQAVPALGAYRRELAKKGWITAEEEESIPDQIATLLHRYPQASPALLRGSIKAQARNEAADVRLTAWLAHLNTLSLSVRLSNTYKRLSLDTLKQVAKLSRDPDGPTSAIDFVRKHGVIVLVIRPIPGTGVDGCAFWSLAERPLIGLSLRHDRLDNFWFTFLHECAHVALHVNGPEDAFADDFDDGSMEGEQEIEANLAAADAAIPRTAWKRSEALRFPSQSNIEHLAAEVGVSPSIVAGRVQFETKNFKIFRELLGQGELTRIFGTKNDNQ